MAAATVTINTTLTSTASCNSILSPRVYYVYSQTAMKYIKATAIVTVQFLVWNRRQNKREGEEGEGESGKLS
jgi:hypothetical protein